MFDKIRQILGLTNLEENVKLFLDLEKSIQQNKSEALELGTEFIPKIIEREKQVKVMSHYNSIVKSDMKKLDGMFLLDKLKSKLTDLKSSYYISIGELRKSNELFNSKIDRLSKKKGVEQAITLYKKKEGSEKAINLISEEFMKGNISQELYNHSFINYAKENGIEKAKYIKKTKDGNFQPTELQKKAGNYKKDKKKARGLTVTIENKEGSIRSGKDKNGKEWSVTMNNDYGYFNRTLGKDGDHVDVFLSKTPDEGSIYIIDQSNEKGGFDEHKVMIGFDSMIEAIENYKLNFSKDFNIRYSGITEVSQEELKQWLNKKDGSWVQKRKPYSKLKASVNSANRVFKSINFDVIQKAFENNEISEDIFLKAEQNYIEKGRTGNYSDNATNRRLKRVGQKYGSKGQEEQKEVPKDKKQEESGDKKTIDLTEASKTASGSALETASKEASDPEVRKEAHKEIDRRGKEEKVQEPEEKKVSEEGVQKK